MSRSLRTACLGCVAVALAVSAPVSDLHIVPNARAADIAFAADNHHPKATVLVLRPGAWILGTVDNAVPDCRYFAARGYDAVAVDYPFTYFASLAAARSAAAAARAKRLPVYAFGYSAGGNLAAMLAVQGNVTAAVDVAGPVNMVDWLRPKNASIPRTPRVSAWCPSTHAAEHRRTSATTPGSRTHCCSCTVAQMKSSRMPSRGPSLAGVGTA